MIWRFLIVLCLVVCPLSVRAEQSRIAAVVNKSLITKADLNNRVRLAALSTGLPQNPETLAKIQDQLLRVMIDERLQQDLGALYELKVTNEQVKEAISRLEKANQLPAGQLYKMMADNGIPSKTMEDQMRAGMIWVEYIRQKYSPTLQISDAEIARERQLHKERSTKTQYHLAEIVLPFETPEQELQVQADLNRLIEELQRGAHFAALAQQFSQAGTAAQGGDMGWLTEDQLIPEVREFVMHLEPGMLSRPIRTSQGYIIIGYVERRLPSNDAVAELSEEDARNAIAERKLNLLAARELRDLRRHAFIDLRM